MGKKVVLELGEMHLSPFLFNDLTALPAFGKGCSQGKHGKRNHRRTVEDDSGVFRSVHGPAGGIRNALAGLVPLPCFPAMDRWVHLGWWVGSVDPCFSGQPWVFALTA